jgi:hypothetical protein
MMNSELLERVRRAINPAFSDWVLFSNGTYIIFDDAAGPPFDVPAAAVEFMKEYGLVSVGGPAGDFEVFYLDETDGWVVGGHGYGMYTYVHPSELASTNPSDVEIGLMGRSKRDLDGAELEILHVNTK